MTGRARRLRKEATFPERLVWSRLRAGQLEGIRFRRQHPIGPHIVDFYCARAKLAIELDGVSHEDREQHDRGRTRYLESLGIRVVRLTNDEVLRDLDDVVFRIACEVGLEP
jgi:very-short-patch-repair endonuclease